MEEVREEQVHLRDYLRVILKRKWTIITVFIVIVISVTLKVFTSTPIYEATTRLIIDKENPNVVSIQEVMAVDASGTDYYQTQYQIIESRTVVREVIKRLNLNHSVEFFPPSKNSLFANLKRSVTGPIFKGIRSVTSLLKTSEKTAGASENKPRDYGLVNDFVSRITVSPIRNSRLVDVNFQARDPMLAANIVNTLAEAYIDQNLEIKLKAVQDAVKWLTKRIEDERQRVEKAEQALLRYKEQQDIVTDFSSDVEQVTAQKLAQLNAQVVEAESKRVEAETRYKQATSMKDTPDMLDSIPEVLSNELIRQIKSMEVDLYKRMSELSKKYGQNHPQMVAIQSELKTLQSRKAQEINRVINSLRNEYRVAEAKEQSLKAALGRQKRESLDLNQKAIQYTVLKREAESANQMYDLLIKRFKEASLTEDMRTGNIRVIDRAEVPQGPVKPRKKVNILIAMMVGLIAGIGLAFFFEYLDNTIKLPDDIKRYLNIPYLGPVPAIAMSGRSRGTAGNPTGEANPELVTIRSPKSTASEAYRGIRTGILFSSAEKQPQVILVSSAGPREGKTITSSNLAIAMAQAGNRVLLMDCDMRRPSVHKFFNLSREKGLANILVGTCEVKEAVMNTMVPNLDVIPCGPIPPNPSEILGSSRMANLVEVLRKGYAQIVIDSPPLTAVTDPVVLGKLADGVVLVVRAADTPREIVKNGLTQLQSANANVLGVVLNGVEMGKDSYYYYQYYYYYYGEDGERKKKARRKKRLEAPYGEDV